MLTREARQRNMVYNEQDVVALVEAACIARIELGRVNDFFYHGEQFEQEGVMEAHRELDDALDMFQSRATPEATTKLRR